MRGKLEPYQLEIFAMLHPSSEFYIILLVENQSLNPVIHDSGMCTKSSRLNGFHPKALNLGQHCISVIVSGPGSETP